MTEKIDMPSFLQQPFLTLPEELYGPNPPLCSSLPLRQAMGLTKNVPRSTLEGWLDPIKLKEKIDAEFSVVDDDGVLRLRPKS